MLKFILNKIRQESPSPQAEWRQLNKHRKKWRQSNGHNYTILQRIVPFDVVTVGKHSYGPLDIRYFGAENEKLVIGNYCSIAEGAVFLLGGGHPTNTLTTYPFKVLIARECEYEALSKGPIVVEDDVWIGCNALILSGVTIGRGAIVGAGTVVSKDIPPYSIVVGNPARVIRNRFDEKTIEYLRNKILDIDLAEIPLASLYKPINSLDDLKTII
jgi:acetyltransferase-like isoleucine patch superfamily enzyme